MILDWLLPMIDSPGYPDDAVDNADADARHVVWAPFGEEEWIR